MVAGSTFRCATVPASPTKEAAKGTKEAAPKQKEEKGTELPKRKALKM
jgi:hypothetical protein